MEIIYRIKKEEEKLLAIQDEELSTAFTPVVKLPVKSITTNSIVALPSDTQLVAFRDPVVSDPLWLVQVTPRTPTVSSTNMVVHLVTESLMGKIFRYLMNTFERVSKERLRGNQSTSRDSPISTINNKTLMLK